jgi:hypothetical protein
MPRKPRWSRGARSVYPLAVSALAARARTSALHRLSVVLKILHPLEKLLLYLWPDCAQQQIAASLGQRPNILTLHQKPSPSFPLPVGNEN